MVTGAVASIIYGEPRLTHDIDIIVEILRQDINRIISAFPSAEFYCPPEEVVIVESKRPVRGHFNIIHHKSGFKCDIYILGEDELHHWGIALRREYDLDWGSVWVAPPEYVVIRKLEYYKEGKSQKHLRDISGMIDISREQIDFKELELKINELSLEKEWKEAQAVLK